MIKKRKTSGNRDVLLVKNLAKIYALDGVNVGALNGVTFSIPRNKLTMIIGPSGSGKSTLLHLIGLLDKPTKGRVYLEGENTSNLKDSELARLRNRRIGFVFQFFNLHPLLNAVENVELPLTIAKVPKRKRKEKAMELLKLVGLADRAGHFPNQLSGGERQRVAIARALVNEPSIIMADEPTGNLDTKSGRDIMKILSDLKKKSTVIIITHDTDLLRDDENSGRGLTP